MIVHFARAARAARGGGAAHDPPDRGALRHARSTDTASNLAPDPGGDRVEGPLRPEAARGPGPAALIGVAGRRRRVGRRGRDSLAGGPTAGRRSAIGRRRARRGRPLPDRPPAGRVASTFCDDGRVLAVGCPRYNRARSSTGSTTMRAWSPIRDLALDGRPSRSAPPTIASTSSSGRPATTDTSRKATGSRSTSTAARRLEVPGRLGSRRPGDQPRRPLRLRPDLRPRRGGGGQARPGAGRRRRSATGPRSTGSSPGCSSTGPGDDPERLVLSRTGRAAAVVLAGSPRDRRRRPLRPEPPGRDRPPPAGHPRAPVPLDERARTTRS